MRTLIGATVLAVALAATAFADVSDLAGNWIGGVDTPSGQMDLGLNLTVEKGKLVGVLKTAHGDWAITGIAEKDGVWTIDLKSPGGPARMVGRVKGATFAGDWQSPMAKGTFELSRARPRG